MRSSQPLLTKDPRIVFALPNPSSTGENDPDLLDIVSIQVAYVLGQLQNKTTSNALFGILRDVNEHPMVRYEAVEALGSIADTGNYFKDALEIAMGKFQRNNCGWHLI